MGKASQRKRAARGAAADVHEQIAAEAQRAKAEPIPGLSPEGKAPALDALVQSARRAVGASVPVSFMHEGREYWCRVSIGIARLNVFSTPATSEPLVTSLFGSSDDFGHRPFH